MSIEVVSVIVLLLALVPSLVSYVRKLANSRAAVPVAPDVPLGFVADFRTAVEPGHAYAKVFAAKKAFEEASERYRQADTALNRLCVSFKGRYVKLTDVKWSERVVTYQGGKWEDRKSERYGLLVEVKDTRLSLKDNTSVLDVALTAGTELFLATTLVPAEEFEVVIDFLAARDGYFTALAGKQAAEHALKVALIALEELRQGDSRCLRVTQGSSVVVGWWRSSKQETGILLAELATGKLEEIEFTPDTRIEEAVSLRQAMPVLQAVA